MLDIANKIPLMVSVVSIDGHFLFVNKAYTDWLGMEREDVVGKHVEEIVPVTDRVLTPKKRLEAIRDVVDSGATRELEYSVLLPSGDERLVSVTFAPHESKLGIYVFVKDVTDERASYLNAVRYKAVLDTAGEGVVVMTKDGIITSFNKAAERLFGYAQHEIVGQSAMTLMPPSVKNVHHMFVDRYMKQGGIGLVNTHKTIEGDCVRKDGSTFPADLAVGKFEVNGVVYFTAIIRDISERKQHDARLTPWCRRRSIPSWSSTSAALFSR